MAVYERAYRGYAGPVTPTWSRFLIIPRYAYQRVLASRVFVAFLCLCFVFPLGAAAFIYVAHNLDKLAELGLAIDATSLINIGGVHGLGFLRVQAALLGFVLAMIVAPTLISADMRNNGLPLYLSRPFSRLEYMAGKFSVLAILLSAITWVPGLVLFAMQSYLAGREWLLDNWRLGAGLLAGSLIWIVAISLVSLAVSAFVRLKILARASLFGIFFMAGGVADAFNGMSDTVWGDLVSLGALGNAVWSSLLGIETESTIPAAGAWAALIVVSSFCAGLLYWRIRAYEVVSS
ncbi:MAG: hypothetical protein OEQ13_04160 [Acidobacteriota bacterium]|nr:hypothetical protein [Acidobacteriota bacterium]